jgi:light-regulated signal transduction histidine kinase (bacteriophytochrome)
MGAQTHGDRIGDMLELVMAVAQGDHSAQLVLSAANDDLDALAVGINMMIDELRASTAERVKAEREREALVRDLEEANRALADSNSQLQDFAYVASHDLREPMRKIASFGMLLHESLDGQLDDDQRENFQFLIDGATRMQAMIDDLLTYSRVASADRPFEPVDLATVMQDIVRLELVAPLERTGGVLNLPESLPIVWGDLSQLHQLFHNLIGNGLKFHRDGVRPEVTLRASEAEQGMIRIEVSDNGIGFDAHYCDAIFTMFKRLHSRTRYDGTGIGLPVCRKIVERHGGDIGAVSTPGEGSTFWLTLPAPPPSQAHT